nr:NTP transferase domain-containing protein [Bacteroidota bacterium]
MIKEAIILAGGLGTRLSGVLKDIPKAMAPVNGKPFLDYQLDYLDVFSIDHIIISVGHLREQIMDHYGDRYKNMHIEYVVEEEPMGTGGGLKLAMEKVTGNTVYVLNGDTFYHIDYQKFLDIHYAKESKLSIVLRELDNVSRYGSIERDEDRSITGFFEKSQKQGKGFINGGVYLMSKPFFKSQNLPDKFSLEKDFFEKIYLTDKIYGILCRQYFIDIGVPEDYEKAQDDFKDFEYF